MAFASGDAGNRIKVDTEPVVDVRDDRVVVLQMPLGRGCFVRFDAKTVDQSEERHGPGCGYAVYDGKLSISSAAVPHIVLTRGVFFDGEREVELDVSGLGDPWVEAGEMEARNCEMEIVTTEDNDELITLKVAFMKWGAEDYSVTWVVMDGHSLRLSIDPLGDTLPEWMENPKTPQGQYEVGKALWENGERKEARIWWAKAAERGHAKAAEALKRPVGVE